MHKVRAQVVNFSWGQITIHQVEGEVVESDVELAPQTLVFAHFQLGFELRPVLCR